MDNTANSQKSPIDEQCARLEHHIDCLMEAINTLAYTLVPVLTEESPEVGTAAPNEIANNSSALTKKLEEHNQLLKSAIVRLHTLQSRVEL